jgi:hypothetical protein
MIAPSFNLDAANKTITEATVSLVKLMLPLPGQEPPTLEQGQALMKQITDAITTGASACSEVTRYRTAFADLREQHRPQPHPNPNAPGALCTACSLHGALVPWPCNAWTTAEKTLSHGQN